MAEVADALEGGAPSERHISPERSHMAFEAASVKILPILVLL